MTLGNKMIWLVISLIIAFYIEPVSYAMESTPIDVSLIQLIANPDKYHGKFVRVSGYLHNKMEDSGLYLCKEDADYLVGKNSLWVRYDAKVSLMGLKKNPPLLYFDCKMVLLEGTFNKDSNGHLGMFASELNHVSRVLELTRWSDGSTDLKKPGE